MSFLTWDYFVIDKEPSAAHKAMGFCGFAYCCAPTRAAAYRRQLEMGIRATTKVVYMGDTKSPDYDGGEAA